MEYDVEENNHNGAIVFDPSIIDGGVINEMQTCQGLIEHIDKKLDETGSKYDKGAVKKVRNGLEGYNQYIQRDIVTPGLLKYSGGDQSKAKSMQEQVDAYKKTVAKRLRPYLPSK